MTRRSVRALLALVCLASVLVLGPPSSVAVVSGRDGKIAFTRSNQIYTINPGGSGLAKLTTTGKNYWPRWSPDGKRIAYVNETAAGRDLWVMNANGSTKVRVTSIGTVTFGPAWSPDGTWLAFVSRQNSTLVLTRVRAVAPFGTPQLLLGHEVNEPDHPVVAEGTPSWSPDGTELAFVGEDSAGASYKISRYKLTTRQELWMTGRNWDDGDGPLTDPSYDPSGTRAAYTVRNPTVLPDGSPGEPLPPTIEILSLATREPVPFSTVFNDQQAVFAPSNTKMVLMNDAGGAPTIYIAKADGSGRRALTAGYQPDWQRLP